MGFWNWHEDNIDHQIFGGKHVGIEAALDEIERSSLSTLRCGWPVLHTGAFSLQWPQIFIELLPGVSWKTVKPRLGSHRTEFFPSVKLICVRNEVTFLASLLTLLASGAHSLGKVKQVGERVLFILHPNRVWWSSRWGLLTVACGGDSGAIALTTECDVGQCLSYI